MEKRAIAGVIVGLALGMGMVAEVKAEKVSISASNNRVTVTVTYDNISALPPNTPPNKIPPVSIEGVGYGFHIFAPGRNDSFTVTVKVEEYSGGSNADAWTLVSPKKPFDLSPGGSQSYTVKKEEDTKNATIYLYNYYIKSSDSGGAKDITVPLGTQATYTAYRAGRLQESNWKVSGHGTTAQVDRKPQIVINRDWFNVDAWYIGSMTIPKLGSYSINAEDCRFATKLTDSGEMTVTDVRADFIDGGSSRGFDDYTGWTLGATDYYARSKKGHCRWPYVSVKVGEIGSSKLRVQPQDFPDSFDIAGSAPLIIESPQNKKAINGTLVEFQTPSTGESTISATHESAEAQLTVVPFKEQTRKVVCIYVITEGAQKPNKPGLSLSMSGLNSVFKQCVTTFESLPSIDVNVPYKKVGDKWSENELTEVRAEVEKTQGVIDLSEEHPDNLHVVLFLRGRAARPRVAACADKSDKFVYLFDDKNINYIPFTFAHEIGHNFGLDDLYNTSTFESGADKYNLMNNTKETRLRYDQWKQVNPNKQGM